MHLPRAQISSSDLFRDLPVLWSGLERKSAAGLGDDGAFYLVTGRFPFDNSASRDAFLEILGASLVFLIGWNKARKILQEWVPKSDAIRVLAWAARHRVGHRAFLELGGAELVAVRRPARRAFAIGFGERLDHALGSRLRGRFSQDGAAYRGRRLAARQLGAAGAGPHRGGACRAFAARRQNAVAATIRQAGLAHEIAADLAHLIAERRAQRPFDCTALAERARRVEEKADRLAIEARS